MKGEEGKEEEEQGRHFLEREEREERGAGRHRGRDRHEKREEEEEDGGRGERGTERGVEGRERGERGYRIPSQRERGTERGADRERVAEKDSDRDGAHPTKGGLGSRKEAVAYKSVGDMDLSQVECCTPSYRLLPKQVRLPSACRSSHLVCACTPSSPCALRLSPPPCCLMVFSV